MKNNQNIENQAIMSLLYLCEDNIPSSANNHFFNPEMSILKEHKHNFKLNTNHLKTHKNTFLTSKVKIQATEQSQEYHKKSSNNKENLKKTLEKLNNSPSPSQKCKEKKKNSIVGRVHTLNSQPQSNSLSKYSKNRTPKLSKESLNKLLGKKKDNDFIKSLIKAKIVQKLKKIQAKKGEKKAFELGQKIDLLRDFKGQTMIRGQLSNFKTEKSLQKDLCFSLLREEQQINYPVFSRKNSRINIKALLF